MLQIPDRVVWAGGRETEAQPDHGLPGGAAGALRQVQGGGTGENKNEEELQ